MTGEIPAQKKTTRAEYVWLCQTLDSPQKDNTFRHCYKKDHLSIMELNLNKDYENRKSIVLMTTNQDSCLCKSVLLHAQKLCHVLFYP